MVLCDFASLSGKGRPPYGLHPHYGLIAVTAVVEGCFTDADNLNPPEGHHNKPGGVYMVSAGRGVCHDETTVTEGHHSAIQTIFKVHLGGNTGVRGFLEKKIEKNINRNFLSSNFPLYFL